MAKQIIWTDAFSVGSDDIDSQHQKLVKLINWLSSEISSDSQASVEQLLNSLAHYTVYHFGYEDELFEKAGYPATHAHKKEHKRFVDHILLIRERYENGGEVNLEALADYLRTWVTNHICKSDKQMVKWLIENTQVDEKEA